jgi:hypothetical protein
MRIFRLLVCSAAAAAALTIVAPADAGPLDACAQRVIRDWYSGGRVDGAYPLACYRAAIRALPEDVLQYSNADRDIARALAYALQGRRDPGNASPPSSTTPSDAREAETAVPPASERRTTPPTPEAPAAVPKASKPRPRASTRTFDDPVRLASAPAVDTAGAGLPYPVLALATLAALLLVSAAAAALRARRR